MDSLPAVAQYFIGTVGATISGIIYWLTIENLQPLERQPGKFEKHWLAVVLCVILTPLGAWFVSGMLRIRKTLKDTSSS